LLGLLDSFEASLQGGVDDPDHFGGSQITGLLRSQFRDEIPNVGKDKLDEFLNKVVLAHAKA
jgi:hypothetical protein